MREWSFQYIRDCGYQFLGGFGRINQWVFRHVPQCLPFGVDGGLLCRVGECARHFNIESRKLRLAHGPQTIAMNILRLRHVDVDGWLLGHIAPCITERPVLWNMYRIDLAPRLDLMFFLFVRVPFGYLCLWRRV